jgi:predicted DCC family thiol-disulfide oxidoreductase YuxK
LLFLRQFNLPADQVESVVLIQGDTLYTKSTAALRILKELHGWPKLLAAFIFLPRPLRDFVYDVTAKTRYSIFGKRDTCLVATKEISDRFL